MRQVTGKIANWWQLIADGRIQCDLCPRNCRLRDGQRGFCFVRVRRGDALVLDTYGRSSGFAIDPIEKKPLNHFYPGSSILSFGTAGCNLACKFCQNWNLSKSKETDLLSVTATPVQIAKAARANACESVAFTYNDPTIFAEYAIDTAKECHRLGVKAVAVTAGYISPEPRAEFFAHMDAANIDLKAFTDEFYWKQTGVRLKHVLETISYVANETSCWLELTTLLIPGLNDSDEEITALTNWVVNECGPNVPIHFSAFHPSWKLRDVPRTPKSTLTRAHQIGIDAGLNFVYTGNVHDREGDTTRCVNCGHKLIVRDWYRIIQNVLEDGHCPKCAVALPGRF